MADPRDEAYEAYEFDDADISASVEDNRIAIEVPIPANTSPERWGKIVEDLKRRITIDLIGGGKVTQRRTTPENL